VVSTLQGFVDQLKIDWINY